MRTKQLLYLIFSLSLLTFHSYAIADRLMPSDLIYLGAFQVPSTESYAGMAASDSTSSLSYRPNGDLTGSGDGYPGSLFLSKGAYVSEIKIPAPIKSSDIKSLNQAEQIQSIKGITGNVDFGSNDRFGAIAYIGANGLASEKLYWSTFEYYNVDGTDYSSIGWADTTLSSPNAAGLWHVGPTANGNLDSPYHGMKHGDYLIPIDQGWANDNTGGKSLLSGRYREAGAIGGSMGPVLVAIAPWKNENPPPAGSSFDAIPLMSFNSTTSHTADTTWMEFKLTNDQDYTYYSAGDRWHGGAWVAKGTKKAIILVGRHGTYNGVPLCPPSKSGGGCGGAVGTNTPPYCYGDGGTDCPQGIAVTNNHGYHTGPYRPRFLFIDPDELAQVAKGSRTPSSIDAYYSYDPSVDWPWSDSDGFNDVAGAAYDSINGYLYVAQANAYRPGGGSNTPWPVIHVYRVSGPSAIDAPSNLKLVQ